MFDFLVRDYAIAIGLLLFLAGIFRIFPFACKRIWFDPALRQRMVSRAIVGLGLLAIAWITVFDSWRKMIGVLTGWVQDERSQTASDPFMEGTVSDPVRMVSWILFLGAVLGGAYLFARYSRGIVEPIILGPLALIMFYVLNTFRLRMDVESVRIAYGTIDGPIEILSTTIWIIGLLITMAILITAMFIMLWAPVALVFSLIYRATVGKEQPSDSPILQRIRERQSTY